MSLGWGLRGYIGGGPLGAMIPGALIALAICLLLGREEPDATVVAAFGALGIGLGGQETYGQTVGLSLVPATMAWGLLGLALKGAVWGLAGGAILGMALVRRNYTTAQLLIGMTLLVAATWAGWFTVNAPKLVYFSNPDDRPREELWAGLLLGGLVLLFWLSRCASTRLPHALALWGFAGGGLGFGLGGLVQSLGHQHAPGLTRDYWKLMEFTFGFLFGAALAYAAWKHRRELSISNPPIAEGRWPVLLAIAAIAFLSLRDALPIRFEFTIWAAILLALSWIWSLAARQVAITVTLGAFAADFARSRPMLPQATLWTGVVAAVLVTAWFFRRSRSTAVQLLFLSLMSTGVALLKAYAPPSGDKTPDSVMVTFVGLLIVSLWLAYSEKAADSAG